MERWSSMRWILPVALLCLAAPYPAAAQQPIKVDVPVVDVSFSARDAKGALVDSLKKDDIRLFEDGDEQQIEFFSKSSDLPLTLGLIIDVSGSQEKFVKKHEKDLMIFLEEVLGPKDRVFVVGFGNHIRLINDFTNSPEEVIEHMKQLEKRFEEFPELGPKEDRELGTAYFDAIYYPIAEKLAGGTGPRALLVFSDGEDNASSHDMMTTIEEAQAENVTIYSIRYTETGKHGIFTAANKYGIRVMDRVAKETGGAHIDAQHTDPHTYFKQIAEELRTAYELAYYPKNKKRNDSFRKITIRPKDDNIHIRAKTGYYSR